MWWILFEPLLVIPALILFAYYYGTRTYDYWKLKGIPYVKPKFPFLGNSAVSAFSLMPGHAYQQMIYDFFKGHRFGGVFRFTKPALFLRDPLLIESVLIKDFTSFYNRGTGADINLDPLSAHLFHLEDKQWKSLRQKLTPTFSSGKLKGMHQQLVDCSDALVNYISHYLECSDSFEVREVMAKFSTDVIGSCAFGLNTNSLNNTDSEFRKMGRKVFQMDFLKKFRLVVRGHYPWLIRILRWKSLDAATENFFISTIKSTMSYREKNEVTRNDFVQLLMEIKKQELEKKKNGQETDDLVIDDKIITANAFVFFVAGFETTASTLSYCLYELSVNQDIQEQAYQHIVSVLKNHGGEVTYDAVKDMSYIYQIFAETLRMHPPLPLLMRVVTKNYTIPGTSLMLPKHSSVTIPIYSLHYDPEYFPEPDKFKPERFDKEENIRKGTYMPFGDGPRICIGKRFAEMEMQIALAKLLLKYKFTLNPKTISPLVYEASSILMKPVGGIWVDLHKRN